jgi:cathepsin L
LLFSALKKKKRKMKVVVALLAFVAFAVALREKDYQNAFTQWMHSQSKSYAHDEFQYRYQTFKSNLDYIVSYNAKNNGVRLAMNAFGDLTNEEYRRIYLGLKVPAGYKHIASGVKSNVSLPDSYDWRTKDAVTNIKNQEQCGSCWAFSTTGSTEGCHSISSGSLVSLSEQNLVDCSTAEGNQGCDGGLMTQAMDYIISNHGIDTEGSYPYTAEDGTCSYNSKNSGATLKSYVNVNPGDENDLETKVYSGPTSVAIDASQSSFQFYSGGVYYEPSCSSQQLDHGVLAVGWGSQSGTDYWIVKNSWGTSWGQDGYILMSRNKNNNCGIATMATLPQC